MGCRDPSPPVVHPMMLIYKGNSCPQRELQLRSADHTNERVIADGMRPGKADQKAMNEIANEYADQDYEAVRNAFDVLLVRKHTLWQAHHIHEASWGGSDAKTNLQYLPLPEHNLFTQWWEHRRRDIEKKLGIK